MQPTERIACIDWLTELHSWQYFLTLTFKYEVTTKAATQAFYEWLTSMQRLMPEFRALAGVEGERTHLHAVLAPSLTSLQAQTVEGNWRSRYGLTRLSAIEPGTTRSVVAYTLKHASSMDDLILPRSLKEHTRDFR